MAYFFDWGIRMLVFNIVLLVLVFFLVKNINELLRSKSILSYSFKYLLI